MIDTLSTEQLRTLVTIAETGSYTRAAERLFRSQPALSLQIKRLEEQVGAQLFDRDGRDSVLTEAGRLLHGYAERILNLNTEALGKLSVVDAEGIVRIGVLEEVIHGQLFDLLTRFGKLATGINLELEVSTSWELVRKIERNELCLAIANNAYSLLPSTPLWSEQYHWTTNLDFDFDAQEVLPLIVDPIDSPCDGLRDALQGLDASGRRWEVVFASHSLAATQAAVLAGLGIGLISESSLTDDMVILGASEDMPHIPDANISLYRGSEAIGPASSSLAKFLISNLTASARA